MARGSSEDTNSSQACASSDIILLFIGIDVGEKTHPALQIILNSKT